MDVKLPQQIPQRYAVQPDEDTQERGCSRYANAGYAPCKRRTAEAL